MAWYRTHRPQQIADLHLTSVREQLQKILNSGTLSHAYLFAGPKGVGKTSSARILARIANDPRNQEVFAAGKGKFHEPDEDHPLLQKIAVGQSQVVIEQDAASHRGIDDIRQLQEMISVVPTEGYMRVVILDEVHMLTQEAFNALLKMLEEPPARVMFILATTEMHKVPATVQSRCQLIQFRQATTDELSQMLQVVAQQESIELTPDQANQLARLAGGSFRDAVKHFEHVVQGGAIDETLLANLLDASDGATQLLRGLASHDAVAVGELFRALRARGMSFSALQHETLSLLQERMYRAIERGEKPQTLRHIVDLLGHFAFRLTGDEPMEGIQFELASLEWCLQDVTAEAPASVPKKDAPSRQAKSMPCAKEPDTKSQAVAQAEEKAADPAPTETVVYTEQSTSSQPTVALSRQNILDKWSHILLATRERSTALESLLRNTQLGAVADTTLEIQVEMPFHKERLESPKYMTAMCDVFSQELGLHQVNIVLSVVEKPAEVATPADSSASEDKLMAAVEEALLSIEAA